MTVEQLLQPRYKVIADYPGNTMQVGTIFTSILDSYWAKYPANFQKLEWWQDRDESDMPGYVKVTRLKSYYDLPIDCIRKVNSWERGKVREWVADIFPVYAVVDDLLPSTEEEYNSHINQNTQP